MSNFQQQKAQLFRSMDSDTQDFVKRFAEKFGKPQSIEYTTHGNGWKADNRNESITKINSEN